MIGYYLLGLTLTPVIATIILIAATIVLALVVGAYTFGLFGSNVKNITTPSVTLYSGTFSTASNTAICGGTAYLAVSETNPGSATSVTSVTISGGGVAASTVGLFSAAQATVNPGCTAASAAGLVTGGSTPSSTLNIYVSATLVSGSTYNYVINYANGQAVSGSLIAQ